MTAFRTWLLRNALPRSILFSILRLRWRHWSDAAIKLAVHHLKEAKLVPETACIRPVKQVFFVTRICAEATARN
jgi:hypothetical protein